MSKKNKSANARKRRTRAIREKAERAAYVRQKDNPGTVTEIADGLYWHGGWPGLEPGTVIVPAVEAQSNEVDTGRYTSPRVDEELSPYDPTKVYFSSQKDFARGFAANTRICDIESGIVYQRGALYRVEPIGRVEPDPDFAIGGVSWCAPQARIVTVEDPNVMMDPYTATEHVGPYMTWRDGSPVYSKLGEYLRSPEQLASGQTEALFASLMPWTPISHINAALVGTPSYDRPLASKHPAIVAEASESFDVLQRHFVRARRLMAESVEFSAGSRAMLDEVNRLIDPVELTASDPRGLCVARHPRDGVVGACVVTGTKMGDNLDQMVMFVDRVVVTPSWRGKGLGSVLLTTIQQLLPHTVDFAGGHCSPELAPFFAQMGYTVLKPGVAMIIPVRKHDKDLQSVKFPGDCVFYRHGRI